MVKYFILFLWFLVCTFSGFTWADLNSAYKNYQYDPNDFAVEVLEYHPIGMATDWLSDLPFNNPNNALGRPTIDTTGDDWYIPEVQAVPVTPVYPPFRSRELVFLGEGGWITLRFPHPVRDDENNPYGIDFMVFGNAMQILGNGQGWTNGDPAQITVGPGGFSEPGIVSVSQDGVIWYSFTTNQNFMAGNPAFIKLPVDAEDGPFCDSFAPTLGRMYDPANPDPALGQWNLWWAEPANPTLPVDPNLCFESFGGFTVADICQVYGPSAGGTGYDISRLDLPVDSTNGKKWFQYVRVDDRSAGGSAEVDAVSDVSCCGDWKHPYPTGDLTRDCKVNMLDLALLAAYWLHEISGPDDPANHANLVPDAIIDLEDAVLLLNHWLDCNWDCD